VDIRFILDVMTNRKIHSPFRESNLLLWPAFILFLCKDNSIEVGLSGTPGTETLLSFVVSGY
jgi:hypothetical protein